MKIEESSVRIVCVEMREEDSSCQERASRSLDGLHVAIEETYNVQY